MDEVGETLAPYKRHSLFVFSLPPATCSFDLAGNKKKIDKIVKAVVLCVVQAAPDPLPFAYRSGSGVDQNLHTHI